MSIFGIPASTDSFDFELALLKKEAPSTIEE
jgi:hypothetical protein